MAFAIRHPGQVVPFIRLAFTNDLTLASLPAGYFNVVHANSVFTHCPIEVIEECFAHVGRLMAPGAIFDFTFYRTDDADYQVRRLALAGARMPLRTPVVLLFLAAAPTMAVAGLRRGLDASARIFAACAAAIIINVMVAERMLAPGHGRRMAGSSWSS